jgi:hypothetical protein
MPPARPGTEKNECIHSDRPGCAPGKGTVLSFSNCFQHAQYEPHVWLQVYSTTRFKNPPTLVSREQVSAGTKMLPCPRYFVVPYAMRDWRTRPPWLACFAEKRDPRPRHMLAAWVKWLFSTHLYTNSFVGLCRLMCFARQTLFGGERR